MIAIALERPTRSYGHEVDALASYLSSRGGFTVSVLPLGSRVSAGAGYDLLYRRMGYVPLWRATGIPEVHDYSSLSTGTLRRLKDLTKRHLSRRPVLRSFLNGYVRDQLAFSDEVPHVMRDMGVDDYYLRDTAGAAIDYDFGYAGSVSTARHIDRVIDSAVHRGRSILVIGEPDRHILRRFSSSELVTFTGRLSHHDVADALRKCQYGLSYVPDRAPWKYQTSTKLLEYCALGLRIVTNDVPWAREFEREAGGSFYFFRRLEDLDTNAMDDWSYHTPRMDHYRWSSVFDRSGIAQALERAIASDQ